MSKQVTIRGLVHEVDYGYGEKEYRVYSTDMSGKYYAVVGPVEFTYAIPDDFDPRPAKVAALDKEIAEARADFQKRITELTEQKNRLMALEMALDVALPQVEVTE